MLVVVVDLVMLVRQADLTVVQPVTVLLLEVKEQLLLMLLLIQEQVVEELDLYQAVQTVIPTQVQAEVVLLLCVFLTHSEML
jgi:hypothetical protein